MGDLNTQMDNQYLVPRICLEQTKSLGVARPTSETTDPLELTQTLEALASKTPEADFCNILQ